MKVRNLTPFPFTQKVTSRKPPQPEMALLVKGTFTLSPGQPVAPAEDQASLSGELFFPDDDDRAGEARYPGDFADFKPRGEILIRGTCHVPGDHAASECPVRVTAGDWSKTLRVVGKRVWNGRSPTKPIPFRRMPLGFASDFGGPAHPENPAGKGLGTSELPNLELPDAPLLSPGDRPRLASLGPVASTWPQRAALLGKEYGPTYLKTRAPFYAEDFDFAYFQSALPDQRIRGYFRGDEELSFLNLHPTAPLFSARLPGLRLRAFVQDVKGRFREVPMHLDTVFAEPDRETLSLSWRGLCAIEEDDLADVATVLIASEKLADPKLDELHYRALLEDFAADPVGLKRAFPPGFLELAEKLDKGEPVAPLLLDPPKDGAPNPMSAMLQHLLGDKAEALTGQLEQAISAMKQQGTSPQALSGAPKPPPPPILPQKPGSPPPVRVGLYVEQLSAEADRLRAMEKATGLKIPEIDRLVAAANDPRLLQLDPTYKPRRPGDPPRDEPGPHKDLSGQDLSGRDLSGADLRGASFEGAILHGACLKGANLRGANLKYAVLYEADLRGADLTGADLRMANVGKARAEGVVLEEAHLDETTFEKADLAGAKLRGARGEYTQLTRANLMGASAQGCELILARFDESILEGADFTGAGLARSSFSEVSARRVVLADARLGSGSFEDADLEGAQLTRAHAPGSIWLSTRLDGADLRAAWMPDAILMHVSARGAVFAEANLEGARFYRASLERASFESAKLVSTDFGKATLDDVRFRGANLYDAKLVNAAGKRCDFAGANVKRALFEPSRVERRS